LKLIITLHNNKINLITSRLRIDAQNPRASQLTVILYEVFVLKKTPQQIVETFNSYNFHDDTIMNMQIVPSTIQGRYSRIVLDFEDDDTGKLLQLTITGCANISLVADFDVLKDNSGFGNTNWTEAIYDEKRIKDLMSKQINELNVEYLDEKREPSEKHPTKVKIANHSEFVLFRIGFFGGTMEVIGRNFKVNRPRFKKAG
jgi:hypothetical protein